MYVCLRVTINRCISASWSSMSSVFLHFPIVTTHNRWLWCMYSCDVIIVICVFFFFIILIFNVLHSLRNYYACWRFFLFAFDIFDILPPSRHFSLHTRSYYGVKNTKAREQKPCIFKPLANNCERMNEDDEHERGWRTPLYKLFSCLIFNGHVNSIFTIMFTYNHWDFVKTSVNNIAWKSRLRCWKLLTLIWWL